VKILLDECVDRRFARDLVGHQVTTVQKRGWSGIKNGELLALAEKEFNTFVTVDRRLASEQRPHQIENGRRSTPRPDEPIRTSATARN
jgi:hypothetical protein